MSNKKVKIITRHAINNYGSFLQSYATLLLFKEMGYEPEIIDYISKNEKLFGNLISFANKRNYNFVKKMIYIMVKFPEELYKNIKFAKQRKKHLKLTKKYNSSEKMQGKFDDCILCSGSDQLWGYMPNEEIDFTYYLNFSNETNRLISLSSSFGRYDFSQENIDLIKNHLDKYDFITVREESAKKFLEGINISSTHVLDPTLLVDRSIYHEFAKQKANKGEYIVVYKLRHDNQLDELANVLAEKHNLKIKYITNSIFFKNKNGKNYANKSVKKVLSLIRDSKFVVTDSFHATVLSVIFSKNFFTHLPGKTNSRIVDFLDSLNLSNRYFSDIKDLNVELENVSYESVYKIIDSYKEECIKNIKELLNNKIK